MFIRGVARRTARRTTRRVSRRRALLGLGIAGAVGTGLYLGSRNRRNAAAQQQAPTQAQPGTPTGQPVQSTDPNDEGEA